MDVRHLMSRDELIIRLCSWFILGVLLVFSVSYIEGGDGGNWDGINSAGSFGEIGYPYRWMYYIDQGSTGYSARYNLTNFVFDGIILTLISPFILEPIRLLLKKLKLRENASDYYCKQMKST